MLWKEGFLILQRRRGEEGEESWGRRMLREGLRETPRKSPSFGFRLGPSRGADAARLPFRSNARWLSSWDPQMTMSSEGTARDPRSRASPLLRLTEFCAPSGLGASWGFLEIQLHSPKLRAINSPNVNTAKGREDGGMRSRSQPQPQPCRLLLEPPHARRGRSAASSCVRKGASSLQCLHPLFQPYREGGQPGTRTATGRSSSRAQDPGGSES